MCNLKFFSTLSGGKLVCPECGKTFNRQASLKCHLAIHGKEDNLACDKCGEEFQTYKTLHIHESEEHCMITFLKEEELRVTDDLSNLDQTVFLKTGSDLTPQSFNCKTCGRVCKNPRELKEHQMKHGKLESSLGLIRKGRSS